MGTFDKAQHPSLLYNMFDVTYGQHQLVYNALSFTLACMMASTVFFWMRVSSVAEQYKSALVITGLVTFIAAYHYIRIFNSWTEAYSYVGLKDGDAPKLTGIPFNDAYRYMDWLLTVPLLLIEIVYVMKLPEEEQSSKAFSLGSAAALMIILGYPGELIMEGDMSGRWLYWALAMLPFLYIVQVLLVGLAAATNAESDPKVKAGIKNAQIATVISWLTYPVVYIAPMLGVKQGADSVVAIQLGYCVSDIISKCGVGLLVYSVTVAKSQAAIPMSTTAGR